MINFSFNISWPWSNSTRQVDYIEKTWKITKNKSLEIQFSKLGNTLVGVSFHWLSRCDHAGVMLDMSLFGYLFMIHFYDNRHWNYKKGRYVNYDDPEEVEKYW
jgi:hypothetical protein